MNDFHSQKIILQSLFNMSSNDQCPMEKEMPLLINEGSQKVIMPNNSSIQIAILSNPKILNKILICHSYLIIIFQYLIIGVRACFSNGNYNKCIHHSGMEVNPKINSTVFHMKSLFVKWIWHWKLKCCNQCTKKMIVVDECGCSQSKQFSIRK